VLLEINQNYLHDNVKLELVDVSQQLPKLKRNPGLSTWVVWDRLETDFYASFAEVPPNRAKEHPNSMFAPPQELLPMLHLERCMRFLPHFQNTGGFFITVLQKIHHHYLYVHH